MMRVGVPVYRLPPEVVQREIDAILAQGVELKLNTRIDNVEALLQSYDAVFVAIGAHEGVKLPIPGNDLPQVLLATEFLRQINLSLMDRSSDMGPGEAHSSAFDALRAEIKGRRVLVLGGGNVAIDAAMSAVRLGASWVGMTCLEGWEQMPAHEWEVREAVEEGIQIFPSRTFKEIVSEDGRVSGVRTVNVNFRGFIDGRPDFDEFPETETVLQADVVIFAVGQRPQSDCLRQV
jgi:NADPH-dependent glutamate synthase beta subunit-like oxidoreductase